MVLFFAVSGLGLIFQGANTPMDGSLPSSTPQTDAVMADNSNNPKENASVVTNTPIGGSPSSSSTSSTPQSDATMRDNNNSEENTAMGASSNVGKRLALSAQRIKEQGAKLAYKSQSLSRHLLNDAETHGEQELAAPTEIAPLAELITAVSTILPTVEVVEQETAVDSAIELVCFSSGLFRLILKVIINTGTGGAH